MIASLRGLLAHADATAVILDVGGVGYKVNVPASIHGFLPGIGESVFLHIHFPYAGRRNFLVRLPHPRRPESL